MADGSAAIQPIDPGVNIIPNEGDYVFQFNRYYLAINPDPHQGPVTWRVSEPDEFPCGTYELTRCRPIPELPLLDSSEEPAPKSTLLFDACVNIPELPHL